MPHSLRRTYATLLRALDRDIPFAKAQMGHKQASMLLDVYAGGVHPAEKRRLAALVHGEDWAAIDQSQFLPLVGDRRRGPKTS